MIEIPRHFRQITQSNRLHVIIFPEYKEKSIVFVRNVFITTNESNFRTTKLKADRTAKQQTTLAPGNVNHRV